MDWGLSHLTLPCCVWMVMAKVWERVWRGLSAEKDEDEDEDDDDDADEQLREKEG